MQIQLTGKNWHSSENVWVRGYCFNKEEQLLEGETLSAYFASAENAEQFSSLLHSANGIFAVIIDKPNFHAFAIDQTRIYPLYYTNELHVSDSPYPLMKEHTHLNRTAEKEYKCSGATFAGNTLLSSIKEVKPSHFIVERYNGMPEDNGYFRYLSHTNQNCTEEEADQVFLAVFQRMLQSIHNRQIVVPLSSGYDSRLIACMLKRLGVSNVVCYTIGHNQSTEQVVAKQVATQLGFPYYFINVTSPEVVEQGYLHSDHFNSYVDFIGNLQNFTWLADYFAVKYLKKNNLIAEDAVFVPGHSGDFIAGSHSTKALVSPHKSANYIVRAILYDNFEYGLRSRSVKQTVKEYVAKRHPHYPAHRVYNSFILQNRITHQINNSARVYEFFGYDVRLPFFDKQLLKLFKQLPYDQLNECAFYNNYVRNRNFIPLQVDFPKTIYTKVDYRKQKIKNRLKVMFPHLCRRHTLLPDETGEYLLVQPMLEELQQTGKYNYSFRSANEVMKEWYLRRAKKGKK